MPVPKSKLCTRWRSAVDDHVITKNVNGVSLGALWSSASSSGCKFSHFVVASRLRLQDTGSNLVELELRITRSGVVGVVDDL